MRYVVSLFCLAQLACHTLCAQSGEQLWFEYMLNYPFANSWNVELAGTYSTVLGQPKWRTFDVQLTPEYSVTQNVDILAAVYTGKTFQTESLTTAEVRGMIGTRLHFTPNRRILTRLLVRFEQRNQKDEEADSWDKSTRMRLRAETLTPLNKKSMFAGDDLWYLILDVESFIVMDNDVNERFANRFRFRTGVGYRFNYNFRAEFIYTLQESKNTLDDDHYTADNIFRFRLKHYLHKAKPSSVGGIGN